LGKKILDLEPLYSTEKKGKTRVWYASIYHDTSTNTAHSVIQFGQENGKMQTSVLEYTKGKYIGKKNETTPLEQCTNETQRKWIDKKEKEGYKEENDAANDGAKDNDGVVADRYYPMLAKTYDPDDKKNKIVYPCHLQPKLDGLRCIVYTDSAGSVVFQSREGGHFVSMGHLIPELSSIFEEHPSVVFDGELYTTDIPFEELAGLIKKQKISAADKIRLRDVHYHIYDLIPSDTQPFHARYETLQAILHESYQHIDLVPTHIVHSIDEFKKWFKEYTTKHQMEGVMLRNSDGIYVQKHRSDDLQKYKEFLEEEFEIVGFKEGDGRDKGCVIWECQTPEKRRFYVRPKGTLKMRQDLFKHGNDYIGAKLTVIFQEKSEQGVPRFPIGKSIRDGF
jgi:ATP-dependent DNA ligase